MLPEPECLTALHNRKPGCKASAQGKRNQRHCTAAAGLWICCRRSGSGKLSHRVVAEMGGLEHKVSAILRCVHVDEFICIWVVPINTQVTAHTIRNFDLYFNPPGKVLDWITVLIEQFQVIDCQMLYRAEA